MNRKSLHLYFIAGTINCRQSLVLTLSEALQAGVTMFQFREKGKGALSGEAREKYARQLLQICKQFHVPFLINDDWQLAIKIGADGVHIGQEDTPVELIRRKWGKTPIIGLSTHNLLQIEQAAQKEVDYMGIGAIFPTNSKSHPIIHNGPHWIEEARKRGISIPIVGIGGIDATNHGLVRKAGADGIAVIRAISQAEHIERAVRSLLG